MRIVLVCMIAIVAGLQSRSVAESAATRPASTQPAANPHVVQIGETRVTLISVSSGVAFEAAKDGQSAALNQPYVRAAFLVAKETAAPTFGEMRINDEPIKLLPGAHSHLTGKIFDVEDARRNWPHMRMDRVPENAKSNDSLVELTYFGAKPLPADFQLSIEVDHQTFEFTNVLP